MESVFYGEMANYNHGCWGWVRGRYKMSLDYLVVQKQLSKRAQELASLYLIVKYCIQYSP